MKVTYQTIEYDANLPVCIRVRDGPGADGTGEPHWHKEPELVYIDSGELTVTAGMNHSVLKAGDVAIIIVRSTAAISSQMKARRHIGNLSD